MMTTAALLKKHQDIGREPKGCSIGKECSKYHRKWDVHGATGQGSEVSLDHQSSHGSPALPLAVPLAGGRITRGDDEGGVAYLLDVGRASILEDDSAPLAISDHEGVAAIVTNDGWSSILPSYDHGCPDRFHGIGVAVLG